jgi:hypothetical protein
MSIFVNFGIFKSNEISKRQKKNSPNNLSEFSIFELILFLRFLRFRITIFVHLIAEEI